MAGLTTLSPLSGTLTHFINSSTPVVCQTNTTKMLIIMPFVERKAERPSRCCRCDYKECLLWSYEWIYSHIFWRGNVSVASISTKSRTYSNHTVAACVKMYFTATVAFLQKRGVATVHSSTTSCLMWFIVNVETWASLISSSAFLESSLAILMLNWIYCENDTSSLWAPRWQQLRRSRSLNC